MHDVRRNLERLLREHIPADVQDGWSGNAGNEALLRMVIATGFYPDVAVYKGKRNAYQLRRLRDVRVPVSSCAFEPGHEIRSTLRPVKSAGKSGVQPVYHVYEDLVDVGMKMVMKVTAVDPLVLMLLSTRISRRLEAPGRTPALQVDEWLTVQPDTPSGISDLNMISETRLHLAGYLQWSIQRMLSRRPMTEVEEQAQRLFEEGLLALIAQSTIHRQRILTSL